MKRNEIIQKLVSEGFSEKTLVNFTDKQLNDLSTRMLGEQEVGGYKEGPGEINVTVSVDGMVVHPGDIIVVDYDGVFAIRPDIADELAALVMAVEKKEKDILKQIAKGTLDRKWVDQSLRAKGVLK